MRKAHICRKTLDKNAGRPCLRSLPEFGDRNNMIFKTTHIVAESSVPCLKWRDGWLWLDFRPLFSIAIRQCDAGDMPYLSSA